MTNKIQAEYDIIIIGGGVAGLSAALYASRSMLKTLVLEKFASGGQILNTTDIENYPGFPDGITGPELSQVIEEQVLKFGGQTIFDLVESVDLEHDVKTIHGAERDYTAKTIILATGGEHRKLEVAGEEEFSGRGVSYCATCDGNFFTDQDVVVVGGGDAAIDEGLYLTGMAKTVTVIHRRDKLKASPILQNRALAEPKMEFRWNHVVEEIKGNGRGVEKLLIRNVKDNKVNEFDTNGVFIYIGFYPNSSLLNGLIDMDSGGHVITDIRMGTSIAGVFACGDIRQYSDRHLGTAVGDGITAALSAYRFIKGD